MGNSINRDQVSQRATSLLNYLREYALTRTKIKYDLDSYEKVIWLSNIPKSDECYFALNDSDSDKNDTWISIKKVKITPVPELPKELESLVDKELLLDYSNPPELPLEIVQKGEGLEQIWDYYLERLWLPWAIERERLAPLHEFYAQLHEIYQQLKREGESFELIIGLGLLSWNTPSGHSVYRQIIEAQAAIELSETNGTLSIGASAQGARLNLENEMLDSDEKPNVELIRRLETELSQIGDDIWEEEPIKNILRNWINDISATSNYEHKMEKSPRSAVNPILTFSPALILRKRSERSLVKTYEEIIDQIDEGGKIPKGIRRLIEYTEDSKNDDSELDDPNPDDNEIIFPLSANEDQKKIVEYLNNKQGVLVQGPPGTGKSHTIANLVCHLLAKGKRILITSQTPRALKVLKDMIPEPVRPLCVSLLGNDIDSLKNLVYSVNGITERQQDFDERKYTEKLKRLRTKLAKLREKQSELQKNLIELKEFETYKHVIVKDLYEGTALKISQKLSEERNKYGWLKIDSARESRSPVSNQQALRLLELLWELSPEKINEAEMDWPFWGDMTPPEIFAELYKAEIQASELHESFSIKIDETHYHAMRERSDEELDSLKIAIEECFKSLSGIDIYGDNWIDTAIDNIIHDNSGYLEELSETTNDILLDLLKEAREADKFKLDIPGNRNLSIVLANATELLEHIQKGGRLGFLFMRPKAVRNAVYLIKETHVNGQKCNNIETLNKLIKCIQVDLTIDRVWNYWEEFTNRISGNRVRQVTQLTDLNEKLQLLLIFKTKLTTLRRTSNWLNGFLGVNIRDENLIKNYIDALEKINTERSLNAIRSDFSNLVEYNESYLFSANPHPITNVLQNAILERDVSAYSNIFLKLKELTLDRDYIEEKEGIQENIEEFIPDFCDLILNEPDYDLWQKRLSDIEGAWCWNVAKNWVENTYSRDESSIKYELHSLKSKIEKTTAELAALMAWKNCLESMTEVERENLKAWAYAVRRLGKEKGKYTAKYRQSARQNMEGCKSAIPAWIMPIYRIADNISPSDELYDVLIIDEASQSGPTALFLFYLAKKIIVVGDEEQISPDEIGISDSTIFHLEKQYLNDIPRSNIFGRGSSVYSIAHIIFGNHIRLREHFRCMPEIVQFSNDLCYSNKPLVPLRQYPPDRVDPVKAIHIGNGYRKGDSRRVSNPPEVDAIVKKIVECCRDPRYKNKSMGVISLLGNYQARVIERRILEYLSPEEIEDRKLICGNAYTFQGDERDIIFLSMVAAPDSTAMHALVRTSDKQRFNVAASRAKDQMWLFHTPTLNDFRNKECLRYRLLEYCHHHSIPPTDDDGINLETLRSEAYNKSNRQFEPPDPFDSWFEVDVYLKIRDRGYKVIPQFGMCGYYIDLMVEGKRSRLAVECDGDEYHSSPEQVERDLLRQRMLERAGLKFYRIRGGEYYYDPDQSLLPLWALLEKLQIYPVGRDEDPEIDFEDENNMDESNGLEIVEANNDQNSGQLSMDIISNSTQTRKSVTNIKKTEIKGGIISVLKKCPNLSCTKKSLTSRILKDLNLITRGKPRQLFEKRVFRILDELVDEGYVEEYKAKNERIRLFPLDE